jgi:light-regulated signal transduction histidine kinase (bacteriophytochrome)
MNRRVVINADSDREIRKTVNEWLHTGAEDIHEASSAGEALAAAKESPAALAIISATTLATLLERAQEYAEISKQLERAREEFQVCVSRVNHDLAETLRGASTLEELLGRGEIDRLQPNERAFVQTVAKSAEQSRTLLRYLAAYAQVLREPVSSHRKVELKGVVLAAQAGKMEEFDLAGATIEAGALPAVKGSPARLQQLVGCLLSNSLKYRNPEKPLQVSLSASRESEQFWRVSVADNGIGIGPQYHESIFEPFQRLHGREVPGVGMGLALSRRIVEVHGGKLWVESKPEEGSTFHFTLRAADTRNQ